MAREGALPGARRPGEQQAPASRRRRDEPFGKSPQIDIRARQIGIVDRRQAFDPRRLTFNLADDPGSDNKRLPSPATGTAPGPDRIPDYCRRRRQRRELLALDGRKPQARSPRMAIDHPPTHRERRPGKFDREAEAAQDRGIEHSRLVDDPYGRPFGLLDEAVQKQLGALPALVMVQPQNIICLVHDDEPLRIVRDQRASSKWVSRS